ncbi:phage tail tip lysozyme [Rhodococcus sp. NCIMB 12038]|uniref:phage tail tip lysozyme n=1 Tax=Rhodococcus sp. NCIMB 12038 TaxID=933800 RepID=UPI000B3D013E|nr:phage tail tip lysozyme [Rhodococcus sp. NCIMB 12038]OUS97223.1 hypothetical protein CA951_02440 [Rhodococcus sp. NCIMB 12038]
MSKNAMGPTQPRRSEQGSEEQDPAAKLGESTLSKVGAATGNTAFTGAGLAMNAARGGSRWVGAGFRKLAMAGVQAGAKVSGLTGGALSVGAGTGVAVGGSGLILALVLSLGGQAIEQKTQRREALIELCQDLTESPSTRASNGDASTTDASMEEQARKVYSVLSYAGMNDQNIAGVLGNFETESGIDPTSIQNIFDEPYKVGPKKEAKIAAGGFGSDSTGLGLGQWTGARAQHLLDYAEAKGGEWYDIEIQLAFAMSEDSGASIFKDMISGTNPGADDPGDAAFHYLSTWEKPAEMAPGGPNDVTRRKQAELWYVKMTSWTVESKLGSSVLALAGEVRRSADNKALVAELLDCPGLSVRGVGGGNSSAAEAMVSFAWPFLDDSRGNDGTDLYQYVHDQVYTGDAYYASCDRGVGSAVRWSGTDDSFPAGPVSAQEQYVNGEGRDKWEKVGSAMNEANLKPGDVLIAPNHVEMYVGEEAVKKVWPDESDHEPNAVIAHASLNDRSPALDSFGAISDDGRTFVAYRPISKEKNSVFAEVKAPAALKPGKGDRNAATTTPGP